MHPKSSLPVFRTVMEIPQPLRKIGVGERNLFLGSCFAEHIGGCFADACLLTTVNPLGVMYNPQSICRLLMTRDCTPADTLLYKGMWHTWLGDSTLSRTTEETCQQATSEALGLLHAALADADNLFITLGTSRCYVYKPTGAVVANCHKLPSADFDEVELTQDEIVQALDEALVPLHEANPHLQVIFTVSPYRYAKYGFHESQLSKAHLLLAVEQLQQWHPDWITYFPAYEIILDELRDYRFYAEDMLHPSAEAVRYIWQRFVDSWAANDLQTYLQRWEPLSRALRHRPLNPDDPANKAFQQNIHEQLVALHHDYPHLINLEL